MNSKEVMQAIRKTQPRGTFPKVTVFTSMRNYGASMHVRESDWNDDILDAAERVCDGTWYTVHAQPGDCYYDGFKIVHTISLNVSIRRNNG